MAGKTRKELTLRNLLSPLAAAALLATAPSAFAQTPAPTAAAVPDKAYAELYDAIIGGFDLDELTARAADDIFESMLRNSPEMADLARSKPGMRERFVAVCMPYMKLWTPRGLDLTRKRSVVELSKSLTPADARQLAAFYNSPLGRKMIKAVGNNLNFRSTADAAMKGTNTDDGMQADMNNSVAGGYGDFVKSLTPEENRQFLAFIGSDAFKQAEAMSIAMGRVKTPGPEEISTPAERDALTKAMIDFFTKEMQSN